jgi:uncharacterized membrane protein YuzA (DUF378 family)
VISSGRWLGVSYTSDTIPDCCSGVVTRVGTDHQSHVMIADAPAAVAMNLSKGANVQGSVFWKLRQETNYSLHVLVLHHTACVFYTHIAYMALSVWLHIMCVVIVLCGAIQACTIGLFGYDIIAALCTHGESLRIIDAVIAFAAIYMLQRDIMLPFLGRSAYPCGSM